VSCHDLPNLNFAIRVRRSRSATGENWRLPRGMRASGPAGKWEEFSAVAEPLVGGSARNAGRAVLTRIDRVGTAGYAS
jgi:hypothetical protein